MTLYERTGQRDLAFSRWHRKLRSDLHWIDLDHVAYCARCKEVLYVAEICFDNGQYKATTITRLVADGLGVPALLIRYRTDDQGEISGFAVRRIAPTHTREVGVSPEQMAEWFERKHDEHICGVEIAARSDG